jgi:hypothetical protein
MMLRTSIVTMLLMLCAVTAEARITRIEVS